MQSKVFVNGPINTVRLEGGVGKIKKKICLFMDIHLDPDYQLQCDDIRSDDIGKFLVDTFDKNNKIQYDLFVEQFTTWKVSQKKDIYLKQIRNIFSKSLKKDLDTNKVIQSELVPNVRFHYVDIRDHIYGIIDMFNIFDIMEQYISYILNPTNYYLNYYNRLVNDINNIRNITQDLYDHIYTDKYNLTVDNVQLRIKKTFDKIRKSYKNHNIKKKINKIIDNELAIMFKDCFTKLDILLVDINNIIEYFKKFGDNNPYDILMKKMNGLYNYGIPQEEKLENIKRLYYSITDIYNIWMIIGAMIMDLFLLRRLLDKNYVENALVYTGAAHSCNYILLLVKYFNFNITHYSYLKDDNIKKSHNIIKSSTKHDELNILFFPPILTQCSNLTSFPTTLT